MKKSKLFLISLAVAATSLLIDFVLVKTVPAQLTVQARLENSLPDSDYVQLYLSSGGEYAEKFKSKPFYFRDKGDYEWPFSLSSWESLKRIRMDPGTSSDVRLIIKSITWSRFLGTTIQIDPRVLLGAENTHDLEIKPDPAGVLLISKGHDPYFDLLNLQNHPLNPMFRGDWMACIFNSIQSGLLVFFFLFFFGPKLKNP